MARQPKEPGVRVNRITKARILVARAEDEGLDPEDGAWVTVCLTHGYVVNHSSKRLAAYHAAVPEWCEDCQQILIEKGVL